MSAIPCMHNAPSECNYAPLLFLLGAEAVQFALQRKHTTLGHLPGSEEPTSMLCKACQATLSTEES